LKSSKPASHHPNLSDVHITDAEDSQSSYTPPRGHIRLCLNPDTPMSNSSRWFSACRSIWKNRNRDRLTSRGGCPQKRRSDSRSNQPPQASQHTTEIAVSSDRGRSSDSPSSQHDEEAARSVSNLKRNRLMMTRAPRT